MLANLALQLVHLLDEHLHPAVSGGILPDILQKFFVPAAPGEVSLCQGALIGQPLQELIGKGGHCFYILTHLYGSVAALKMITSRLNISTPGFSSFMEVITGIWSRSFTALHTLPQATP